MSKKQKFCIFCEGSGLSKEHFWPEWASEHLPLFEPNTRVEEQIVQDWNGKISTARKLERQGHTWNKTLRVVCEGCNNGWMSRLEEACKPLLLPMIRGQKVYLGVEAQTQILTWVALKAMVAEQSIPDELVTTAELRRALYVSNKIPENFSVWIGRCDDKGWQASYFRQTATITATSPSSNETYSRNTHSICFGLGKLFVLALHTTDSSVANRLFFNYPIMRKLMLSGTVEWPPPPVSSQIASEIAYGRLNPLNQGHIMRVPLPSK